MRYLLAALAIGTATGAAAEQPASHGPRATLVEKHGKMFMCRADETVNTGTIIHAPKICVAVKPTAIAPVAAVDADKVDTLAEAPSVPPQ